MNFKVVSESPETLDQQEALIVMPDFIQEIRDSNLRVAKGNEKKLTQVNMLRNALVLAGMRFLPDTFNAFRIPLSKYEGLEYSTEQDISEILVRIVSKHSPDLIDAVIVQQIRDLPSLTRTVYFVGPEEKADLLQRSGLVRASQDEVLVELDEELTGQFDVEVNGSTTKIKRQKKVKQEADPK